MAARYYFNKDVRDLNLVESAFIAGSVKAPQVQSVYQVLKNERAVAVEAANEPQKYVIKNMFDQAGSPDKQRAEANRRPYPLITGSFALRRSLVELERSHLEKPESSARRMISVKDLNTAGSKSLRTLDNDMQQISQLEMRRNLSS